MFEKIIGYESIKQELSTIIHWYTEPDLDPAIRLPRGVLLVGAPGLGKTLFMRAVTDDSPLPVHSFVHNGERDVTPELIKLFEDASAEPNGAIVLIDEFDTLIDRHSRAERCLKELMDGLTPQNRVLFIASANEFLRRSNPLARPGRFDRVIRFMHPDEQERSDILSYYLNLHGRPLQDEELGYLSELTDGCSNADLAAIVTDTCLRNRGKVITADMLERSHALICFDELPEAEPTDAFPWIPCVHEIGHALLMDCYREHYHLHRIVMNKKGERRGACYGAAASEDRSYVVCCADSVNHKRKEKHNATGQKSSERQYANQERKPLCGHPVQGRNRKTEKQVEVARTERGRFQSQDQHCHAGSGQRL